LSRPIGLPAALLQTAGVEGPGADGQAESNENSDSSLGLFVLPPAVEWRTDPPGCGGSPVRLPDMVTAVMGAMVFLMVRSEAFAPLGPTSIGEWRLHTSPVKEPSETDKRRPHGEAKERPVPEKPTIRAGASERRP
jgi:hypothetical protein